MHTIFVSKLFSFSETTYLFLPLKKICKMTDEFPAAVIFLNG